METQDIRKLNIGTKETTQLTPKTVKIVKFMDVKEAVKELKFEFVIHHEDTPEEIVRKFSKLVDRIFGEKLI